MPQQHLEFDQRQLAIGGICLFGGAAAEALAWQTILGAQGIATNVFSPGLWQAVVTALGGRMGSDSSGGMIAEVDLLPLFLLWLLVGAASCLLAARLVRRDQTIGWLDSIGIASLACGWWWLMGVWELSRLLAFSIGWQSLENFLLVSPHLWQAVALAGWLAQPFAFPSNLPLTSSPAPAPSEKPWFKITLGLIAAYVVVFTAMNWRLWFNLRIPHGDSAMYEEHLWNLWHGKGFRSYLDQGLFLGEHIQVIHLLLLPLHLIWPSHLLLELCESAALAIGAIPVFRLTQRSTESARAAMLMSLAYLLYSPLHYLDIEVDLKTFRPESFCVPFFLFALDALEAERLRRSLVLLAIALSAKEDYSLIVAPLGVWIAATAYFNRASADEPNARRTRLLIGGSLALFGVAYLLLATRVVIPYFRDWAELHYVRYFSKFGSTMSEVVWNMLTNPSLLFGELLTIRTSLFGLAMLAPIGFVSLLSPSRLVVGLPLFAILSLNELAADPRHHFHAPLVPIVFWSAAVGVANAGRCWTWLGSRVFRRGNVSPDHPVTSSDRFARQFVATSAIASGLFFSMSPIGIAFWDPHASFSLWQLYAADPRAAHFSPVLAVIPPTARVASTDFVHPRFTHHERSYDYSHYRRRVAGYEERVPEDTEFIVIDTSHPYSDIKRPDQVREFREEPVVWELLPDSTDGYFIVLRRRSTKTTGSP